MALRKAGVRPDEVDYINAHGTSTPYNDRLETMAIKTLLRRARRALAISSTKSMTGHLLGGAGGLEAGISALAVHHQVVPPTINLDNPDPECDLDYVPHAKRRCRSATRCRTRSASAARTRRCCSAATRVRIGSGASTGDHCVQLAASRGEHPGVEETR